jgi:hypothetical protein
MRIFGDSFITQLRKLSVSSNLRRTESCPLNINLRCPNFMCKGVFITNVKGTFLGMSESEEASKRR